MSRSRMVISLLSVGAFSLLPLRIESNPGHNLPQFGIMDACGASGNCCLEFGSICTLDGDPKLNSGECPVE